MHSNSSYLTLATALLAVLPCLVTCLTSTHELLSPPLTPERAVAKLRNLRSAFEHHALEHDRLDKRAGGRQPATIRRRGGGPLTSYYDDYYLVNVSVGTPPQWFLLEPTTTMAGLWLIDSDCTDEVCDGSQSDRMHTQYNKTASTTYQDSGNVLDGDGLEGSIVSDVLAMGQLSSRQAFVDAYRLEDWMLFNIGDGQLGLGWPAVGWLGKGVNTPLQNFLQDMDEQLFTVSLSQRVAGVSTDSPTTGGQLTIGGRDTANCAATWTYTPPMTSLDIWQFQIAGFSVGSSVPNRRKRPAIVLLDFFGIAGPQGNVQNIYDQIGARYNRDIGMYTVSCNGTGSMPDLVFKIGAAGEHEIRVKARDYVQDWSDVLLLPANTCLVAVFGYENWGDGPAWVFGDAFLRSQCALFDIGQQAMAFADSVQAS